MFKPPIYDKINGPASLVELYSEKYKKHIYIFGDCHTVGEFEHKNTISIFDFIFKNIEYNKDKFIDIFIECLHALNLKDLNAILKDSNEDLETQNLYLEQTCKFFYDFHKMINKKSFENARIHNLDIRMNFFHNETDFPFVLQYYGAKVEKQIKNIQNLEIKTKLQIELLELKNNEDQKVKTFLYENWKRSGGRGFHKNSKDRMFALALLYTDLYTLGRIFRSYKDGKEAENIIIYAGENHAQNYIRFFKKLEFLTLYNYRDDLPLQIRKWEHVIQTHTREIRNKIKEAVIQGDFEKVEKYTNLSFNQTDKDFLDYIKKQNQTLEYYLTEYFCSYKTLHIQNLFQPLFSDSIRTEIILRLSKQLQKSPEYFKNLTGLQLKREIQILDFPKQDKIELQKYLGNLLKRDPKDYDSWSVEEIERRIEHILETEKSVFPEVINLGYLNE